LSFFEIATNRGLAYPLAGDSIRTLALRAKVKPLECAIKHRYRLSWIFGFRFLAAELESSMEPKSRNGPRILAICLLFGSGLAWCQERFNPPDLAKRLGPAVVTIQGKTETGDVSGTGFLVNSSGTIVTSLHVVQGLRAAAVTLSSGDVYDSVLMRATDERRDLALLQISGFDLPVVELGNSNELQVGEPVLLIGSPRGLQGSITTGIVSAIREMDGAKVIQTDAASNPGNSGGPMANARGRVIGVLGFKLRDSEGLNFAVPINYVRGLLAQESNALPLPSAYRGTGMDPRLSAPTTVSTLKDVKKLFVARFGTAGSAVLLREMIINRLAQNGRFQIATNIEDSDAALTGTGLWGDNGFVNMFVARLITRNHAVVWSAEHKVGFFATDCRSVADKIVKDLHKAATKEK
jgi:hypothetical protein